MQREGQRFILVQGKSALAVQQAAKQGVWMCVSERQRTVLNEAHDAVLLVWVAVQGRRLVLAVAQQQADVPALGLRGALFAVRWKTVLNAVRQSSADASESGDSEVVLVPEHIVTDDVFVELTSADAHALIAAVEECAARAQKLRAVLRAQHVSVEPPAPLGTEAIAAVVQSIRSSLPSGSQLLCAILAGARRYAAPTATKDGDCDVTAVFCAPTSSILSVRHTPQSDLRAGRIASLALTWQATEVGAYCKQLMLGHTGAVEQLFVNSDGILYECPEWQRMRELRMHFFSRALAENLLTEASGRDGLKGAKLACSKLAKKDGSSDEEALLLMLQLRKRLVLSKKLYSQLKEVCAGQPLTTRMDRASWDSIVAAPLSALQELVKELEASFSSNRQLDTLTPAPLEQTQDKLGNLLLALRVANAPNPLPEPLNWRETVPQKLASVCPFPLLMLGYRNIPGSDTSVNLLGVYVADVRSFLSSPARFEQGERGWGQTLVRGDGYTLYELGRFVDMLVWGNPFVLEMLFLESLGKIVHRTREWDLLIDRFRDSKAVLTSRAVAQVMSTVQAELKQHISVGKPFGESDVALAKLLNFVREGVVELVGPSAPTQEFNEWNFWRDEVDESLVLLQSESETSASVGGSRGAMDPRDVPACMPTPKVDVQVNADIDRSGLREVLVDLDELRPRWMEMCGSPHDLQARLDEWAIPIRLAAMNDED